MMQKEKFQMIFRMQLSPERFLVLSKSITGHYSLAQQVKIHDSQTGNDIFLFIKNAVIMDDEKLKELTDNLTKYVKSLE